MIDSTDSKGKHPTVLKAIVFNWSLRNARLPVKFLHAAGPPTGTPIVPH